MKMERKNIEHREALEHKIGQRKKREESERKRQAILEREYYNELEHKRMEKEITTRIAVENWNRQKRQEDRKKRMALHKVKDRIKSNDKRFPPLIDYVNEQVR